MSSKNAEITLKYPSFIFSLTLACILCGSLAPNQVIAQTAAQPAEVKKPPPAKPPVKPVAKAPIAKAPASKLAVTQPAWPAQLANCKTEAGMNPIKREMCVWQFCKSNWGKGDCPEESKLGASQPSSN